MKRKWFLGLVAMALGTWTASPASAATITKVTNTATAIPVTQLKGGPYDGQVLGLDVFDPMKSYLFDPNTNTWSDGPTNAQVPGGAFFPLTMQDGTYVAISPRTNTTAYIWDPITMAFHIGAPTSYPIYPGPGFLLWAESADSIAVLSPIDCTDIRFFSYSISANTWTKRAPPPYALAEGLCASNSMTPQLLPGGLGFPSQMPETMVVGGRTFFFTHVVARSGSGSGEVYAYDPNTDTWATYPNVSPAGGTVPVSLTIFQGSTKVAMVDTSIGVAYLYDTSTPTTPARELPPQPTPWINPAQQLYAVGTRYFFLEGSKSYTFALARTDMEFAPTPIIFDEATETFLPTPCSVTPENLAAQNGFARYTFQLADGRFLSGYGISTWSHRFVAPPTWWVYDPAGEAALGGPCACQDDCLSGICALDSSDAANTCVECAHDDNCAGNPNGPICDPQKHVCGPCSAVNNTQCPANAAFCDTSGASNQCVGCGGDLGSDAPFACPNPNQSICGTSGVTQGMCVECTSDQSCHGTTPVCDTQTFRCVPACSSCPDGGSDGGHDGGTTDKADASVDDNTGGDTLGNEPSASGGGCSTMPGGQPGASAFIVGMMAACLAFARRRRSPTATCPREHATHRLQ